MLLRGPIKGIAFSPSSNMWHNETRHRSMRICVPTCYSDLIFWIGQDISCLIVSWVVGKLVVFEFDKTFNSDTQETYKQKQNQTEHLSLNPLITLRSQIHVWKWHVSLYIYILVQVNFIGMELVKWRWVILFILYMGRAEFHKLPVSYF